MCVIVKNWKDKPMIRLDKLGRKYLLNDDDYECLLRRIGRPLQLHSIDHLKDGDVWCVTVFMPEKDLSYTAVIYPANEAEFTLLD